MSTTTEEEWVTVAGRSKSGRRKPVKERGGRRNEKKRHASFYRAQTINGAAAKSEDISEASVKDVSLQIIQCAACLGRSEYMPNLLSAVQNVEASVDSNKGIGEIVCYGIGNFSRPYSPSMLQLACVLELRCELATMLAGGSVEKKSADEISVDMFRKKSTVRMFYFEPQIISVERKTLEEFEVEIIERNEQGKRRISNKPFATLFFMPHCPMRLYSNVLWANWDPKNLFDGKLVIFGNDFDAYDERTVRTEERSDRSNCIFQILPFTRSTRVQLLGEKNSRNIRMMAHDDDVLLNLERAFCDSSVTWFHENVESRHSGAFPDQPEEYSKNDDDCELL